MQASSFALLLICVLTDVAAAELALDDQFELPAGFHIFRVASAELTGGSYALTFDGQGRLLIGDGTAVRRLSDTNNDGVFDRSEVIATGLGWRGPQGLLVYGDKLFAVGGDGVQVYRGYNSGKELIHEGRIGAAFNTGGDHDAHTILRGFDGYLYLMAGNGAGIEGRKHITETTSPVLFEREASIFRIDPAGNHWECIASGGRNPPNLGLNYLGDLFSFDSDMEWHVGLPWYRPVRLNHWVIGGDQGWQEVGAYPPYYLDNLPGILDVGRGSPTWGCFYEHTQFPEKYQGAYLVCDYRWKGAGNDQYQTTGRLMSFFLERDGATWKAKAETLVKPKPGAIDHNGQPINFALVACEVGPDGSLYLSDHNQGLWRIVYGSPSTSAPIASGSLIDQILTLPQPSAEWARLRAQEIRGRIGDGFEKSMQQFVLDSTHSLTQRLRGVRLLAPEFSALPEDFLHALSLDKEPEIRGQAAWLYGIRPGGSVSSLTNLLDDTDAFVRRRALEGLNRSESETATRAIIKKLSDPVRTVRYCAMTALAHRPTLQWFSLTEGTNVQTRLRGLAAGLIRRDPPSDVAARRLLRDTFDELPSSAEDALDFLRAIQLFQRAIQDDPELRDHLEEILFTAFPKTAELQWEEIRLAGAFKYPKAFSPLLDILETESNKVTQFHVAQSLSALERGWTKEEEGRLWKWIVQSQTGWFEEFSDKGVEFPLFWSTVLADFGSHHRELVMRNRSAIQLNTLLGSELLQLLAEGPDAADDLISLYRLAQEAKIRAKILVALKKVHDPKNSIFLRSEFSQSREPEVQSAILEALAEQPENPSDLPIFKAGLRQSKPETVRACALAISRLKPVLEAELSNLLISRMLERRSLFFPIDDALGILSAVERPDPSGSRATHRIAEPDRQAAIGFWKQRHEKQFGSPFKPDTTSNVEKSDEAIFQLILNASPRTGNPKAGAKVYERVQCQTCHGGGQTPGQEGRLFGPDLNGVTQRLSPRDLAESIVYPSKQVADRFKAMQLTLLNGESLTGFITEQTDEAITLADAQQVRRFPRKEVKSVIPQATSLMPEHLVNGLGDEEIRDLIAFLGRAPASAKP